MATIYTAPSMSFVDNFINAAKYRDQRTDASNQRMMQGMEGLVRGAGEAYKWQKRKNILDEADDLDAREKEILAEIARLKNERNAEASDNMSAIMQSSGWKGVPYPYEQKDEFVAPKGLGILKKEYL